MPVSIIGGTGNEGFGLALRWARAGIDVVIGSRDAGRAADAADAARAQLGEGEVSGLANPEAAAAADVVVVAVPFAGQAAVYASIAEHVQPEAVVVDCTVPLAAATGGKPTRVLGVWEGSAAQQAAGILPKGALVCGAFHTLSAPILRNLDRTLEGDVLVCGPRAAKPAVRKLVDALPEMRFVDAGPLENARLVEPLTALLIGINRRYKVHGAGIRITGLPTAE